MPFKRRTGKNVRRRLDQLTRGEEFELLSQCASPPRHFRDEDERLAAWELHRERLMMMARPGRRPSAFWRYDAEDTPLWLRIGDERSSGYGVLIYEHQVECLLRLGLATAADLAALRGEVDFYEQWPDLSRYMPADLERMRAALAGAVAA
jgi:hypothetical protein